MPLFYPENNRILPSDDSNRTLHKIASLLGASSGGSGGGGTGGLGTIQVYENRDPALPDDPTKAALNFPTNGGPLTQWSVASQAWV